MSRLFADVRLALKSLRRRPGYAAIAIITLALGIGANTAVYSLVRGVLLRPLPYRDPGTLAVLWKGPPSSGETTWLSANEVRAYGQEVRAFAGVDAWIGLSANLTGGGEPERVVASGMTPGLFRTLGVTPALGTGFAAATGGAPEVVISHGLWQRRFGGERDIVGRSVVVNGVARTVVGVLPRDFTLPLEFGESRPSEVFVPVPLDSAGFQGWGNRSFIAVARLAPGATFAQASAQMQAVEAGWMRQGFIQGGRKLGRAAVGAETFVLGDARNVIAILAGAVAMILLIACANVANLTLARADERQRDTALRTALGASRRRIVEQLVTESLVLAAIGAALGAALATVAVRALVAANPTGIPRVADVRVDGWVLAATAVVAAGAGLLFGLWPAVTTSRVNLARTIADGGRAVTAGRARLRFRDALTVAQTALATVLLIGAMLLVRSLDRLRHVDLGFRADGVMTARVVLPGTSYPDNASVIAFYEQLLPRIAALPGVTSAGAARVLPLSATIGDWSISIEGRVTAPNENPNGDWQVVTPGYFETMGARLVRGRLITDADRANVPPVAVLSEAMAAKYWPGEDAIGKRFRIGSLAQPWITVVGVVRSMKHNSVTEGPRTEMYVPHAQWAEAGASAPRGMTLVVRGTRDMQGLADAIRGTVHGLDPALPVAEIRTMADVTGAALAAPRLSTILLGAFAAIALVLATTGLYGVVSLLVQRRRHEIGVRIALGAQTAAILRLVVGRGFRLAAAGAGAGIVGALFLTKLLQGMLFGVTRLDPATYVAVPAFFFLVTVVACLVPARRAAGVDPLAALRDD